MTDNRELLNRITARPDVFGGKPIVRDMRISVEMVLSLLSQGVSPDAILDDYPRLEPDDIRGLHRVRPCRNRRRLPCCCFHFRVVRFLVGSCAERIRISSPPEKVSKRLAEF